MAIFFPPVMFLFSSFPPEKLEKATYSGSCSALTPPEGGHTNTEEAKNRARRQRESSQATGNRIFIDVSGLSVCQDLKMLKQGQNTLALAKHKHTHSVQCEG